MAKSKEPNSADVLAGLRKAIAGARPLIGKDSLFGGGVKGASAARAAEERGFLVRRTATVSGAKGKSRQVEVGELTEAGRRFVLEADSPKAVLESMLPAIQALASPRSDPVAEEIQKAGDVCARAIESAFAKLQKALEQSLARMRDAVLAAVPQSAAKTDLTSVLSTLQEALARVGGENTSPTSAPTLPGPSKSASIAPDKHPTSEAIRNAMRQAYDELCLYVEFRDRLVEIPRLYHEVVRRLPDLTIDRFHHELEAMKQARIVELHKLNEVQFAKDRHLAIEKNDRLYYYVLWN